MRLILFFTFLLFGIPLSAQYRWDKLYNFNSDTSHLASASFNTETDSINFLIQGSIIEWPGMGPLNFIASLDYSGNLIWKKYLRCNETPNGTTGSFNLKRYSPGRYVYSGCIIDDTSNINMRILRPYLYFFDKNGDSIRYVHYVDSIRTHYFTALTIDTNKDIVGAGIITSNTLHQNGVGEWGFDTFSLWVVKLDTLGNRIWEKKFTDESTFSGKGAVVANSITTSADKKHYIIAGTKWNSAIAQYANFILKLDMNGSAVWQRWLPQQYASNNNSWQVIALKGGGYSFITSYSTQLFPPSPGDVGLNGYDNYFFYGKLNENGDTVWTKKTRFLQGHDANGYFIVERENEDLLMGGVTFDSTDIPTLFEADKTGNVKWHKYIRRLSTTYVAQEYFTLNETPDHQILLTGDLRNDFPVPGIYDSSGTIARMTLLDSFGCLQEGCQLTDEAVHTPQKETFGLYPNPVKDKLIVNAPKKAMAIMMDINGSFILQTELKEGENMIDMAKLAAGFYTLKIMDERNGAVYKVVKQE